MALYTVGQQLGNGATVITDEVDTLPDGTTVETMQDSAGNSQIITTPSAGSPAANAQTLINKAANALASNATYLALASPTTAQNATQMKALTRQVNAIIRLLIVSDTSTIADS